MENAKAKGAAIGRPRTTAEQIPAVFLKFYPLYKSSQMTATEFARASNIGRTTLYKYLKIVEAVCLYDTILFLKMQAGLVTVGLGPFDNVNNV